MIMAERIGRLGLKGGRVETISVLTTTLHAREGFGMTLLRTMERAALWGLERRKKANLKVAQAGAMTWDDCLISTAEPVVVAPAPPPPAPAPEAASRPTSTNPVLALLHRLPLPTLPSFSLPRFLASLHAPLTRITSIWTTPPPTALDTTSPKALQGPSWTPTSKWGSLFARPVGVAERWIDGGEKMMERMRERAGVQARG